MTKHSLKIIIDNNNKNYQDPNTIKRIVKAFGKKRYWIKTEQRTNDLYNVVTSFFQGDTQYGHILATVFNASAEQREALTKLGCKETMADLLKQTEAIYCTNIPFKWMFHK